MIHDPQHRSKPPAERAHLWERPTPAHELPAEPVNTEYPRHVHKAGGEFLIVHNDAELEAALDDGWATTPPAAATSNVEGGR